MKYLIEEYQDINQIDLGQFSNDNLIGLLRRYIFESKYESSLKIMRTVPEIEYPCVLIFYKKFNLRIDAEIKRRKLVIDMDLIVRQSKFLRTLTKNE